MAGQMSEYKTLTGLTIEEALVLLMKLLPPDAYSEVGGGGKQFTDISPAYLTHMATKAFGACGIGWFYQYYPENLTWFETVKTNSKGKEYTEYEVIINYMELIFAYFDETGEKQFSSPIISNGGSSNQDRSYALRGALTNCIGAAFAKLLWQIDVYKGKVDHNNAAALWKKQHEANGKASTPAQAAQTTEKVEQAQEQKKETEKKPATPKPEAPKPGSVAEELPKEPDLTLVIPENIGVPLGGQTLADVVKNKLLGEAVLKYLTGDFANASGHKFTPEDDTQRALQQASKEVLASGKYEKPAKKK